MYPSFLPLPLPLYLLDVSMFFPLSFLLCILCILCIFLYSAFLSLMSHSCLPLPPSVILSSLPTSSFLFLSLLFFISAFLSPSRLLLSSSYCFLASFSFSVFLSCINLSTLFSPLSSSSPLLLPLSPTAQCFRGRL